MVELLLALDPSRKTKKKLKKQQGLRLNNFGKSHESERSNVSVSRMTGCIDSSLQGDVDLKQPCAQRAVADSSCGDEDEQRAIANDQGLNLLVASSGDGEFKNGLSSKPEIRSGSGSSQKVDDDNMSSDLDYDYDKSQPARRSSARGAMSDRQRRAEQRRKDKYENERRLATAHESVNKQIRMWKGKGKCKDVNCSGGKGKGKRKDKNCSGGKGKGKCKDKNCPRGNQVIKKKKKR